MDQFKPLSPQEVGQFYKQITEHVIKTGGIAELTYVAGSNQLRAKLTHPTRKGNSVDDLGRIICKATKEVLEAATGLEVHYSQTIQQVPSVHLKPDVGSFVEFSGDYAGLLITNLSTRAAMEIYRGQMLHMGLGEEDLATEHTSDEVVDSIGELINQVIGKARLMIEQKYGLSAYNSQPKAIALTESVTLSIATHKDTEYQLRRLSFKVNGAPFQVELQMENVDFRIDPEV
ncbi:MAG: DUF3334 family protein [bacterium]|nr:DUF3334 family protein [bacterium]